MGIYLKVYLKFCDALNRDLFNGVESYTPCIFSTNNTFTTNFTICISMNVVPLEERVINLHKEV